ncbi:MAG: ABC transporter permease subunit [Planctomycetota bacterium]
MTALLAVFQRELAAYFATPLAYVFIIIFLVLAGVATFQLGSFWERGQADLNSFFQFHPWLYLFLVPAISMRLWAEERRGGTIELLMTLPVPIWSAVAGKFAAAWAFTGIALLLTLPLWVTVSNLGEPDHGAIAAGYVGSFLMAGGFLAIGSMLSAATKSQVIALVLSTVVCFVLLMIGFGPFTSQLDGILPLPLVETIARFSFISRFDSISKGVIDLSDLVYFGALITCALVANAIIIDLRKAS